VLAFTHAHRDNRVRRSLASHAQRRVSASINIGVVSLALVLAGCMIGPNYSREAAPVSTHYKELKGWKRATPREDLARGDWWTVYKDRALNTLLPQVEVSNQTVAAAAAAYEEARAVIREAQAALFPVATVGYSVTRTRTGPLAVGANSSVGAGGLGGTGGRGAIYRTTYTVPISATWDLDVWGRIRRQIEANTSGAQASAADLDNAKLAAQAQLAIAYFNLRAADSLIALLTRTIAEYKRTYEIVNNQFKAGYAVTAGDVATADAQIATTEAQLANARLQRAQFEHAVAILIGRPPAELGVGSRNLAQSIPKIPVSVPSELLERRPDIAGAERGPWRNRMR
jgi:NodT family efflux transporter outer membrane factor (OMF) lipoprotein